MKWVRDPSGRFPQRPHYEPEELDAECEALVADFLRERHGRARYPISTDDLAILIEQNAEDLDLYADLSAEGDDVEGVTDFLPGRKPRVRITAALSEQLGRENRLRTTLTHELTHVKFHDFLWWFDQSLAVPVSAEQARAWSPRCKREAVLGARPVDWMEWQAGYASGALLMPLRPLRHLVVGVLGHASPEAAPPVTSAEGEGLIRRVQEAFQVSADAARVRLVQRYFLSG